MRARKVYVQGNTVYFDKLRAIELDEFFGKDEEIEERHVVMSQGALDFLENRRIYHLDKPLETGDIVAHNSKRV